MDPESSKVYMWQRALCSTYLCIFKKFEDFFRANGWEIVKNPVQADWIVIGTCGSFYSIINDYTNEMKVLAPLSEKGKKFVIYGCLPKIVPNWFKEVAPRGAIYIPTERPEDIEKIMPHLAVRWFDLPLSADFRLEDYRKYDPKRKTIVIQYGCNVGCTYCPHVLGIGPLRSRPKNEILAQVEKLVEDGAHIIVLTGRDAGSWGTDLNPPQTYLDLLNPILEMPGDFEVYVNQFGANWVLHYGEELLKAFLHPKITDIHISIETVSPRLLKLMGRDPRVMEIEPFLKTLREKKPDLMLRTDLLIGFPTETEEELQMTIEFTRKYFNDIACHGFELHPSTPIAKMGLPFYDEITIERKVQHARMFMEAPEVITHRGGQVYETMIEREKRKEKLLEKRKRKRTPS